jgi:hypothetical protein
MPFRGRHTAETKAAISAKLKGIRRSNQTKERISAAMRGKALSAEHRLALRIGHRRTKLFDPERYVEICATQSEVRRRLWAEGVYVSRTKAARLTRFSDLEGA